MATTAAHMLHQLHIVEAAVGTAGRGMLCIDLPCDSQDRVLMFVGDNTGDTVAEPTDQQQGGGEMIENADAPDNPDGYLAEEGGAGAERANESEALPTKA